MLPANHYGNLPTKDIMEWGFKKIIACVSMYFATNL